MGERIRTFDWSQTPLGPATTWSPALRTMLRILLVNRFPHILWWGSHYIQFYNDSYRPIPGTKHPERALGRPASECWAEIWNVIGPLIDRPFHGGPATWDDDIFLEIDRYGFVEECHFTIAYSPVPDETVPSGIGGVLATVHEITGKVVGDRRVLALRDLGAQSAEARTAEDACAIAAKTLDMHAKDIPFALFYLIDPDRKRASLAGSAGVKAGEPASPSVIALEGDGADSIWPLRQAMHSESMQLVEDLPNRLGDKVPPGPWTDRPHTAAVIPIRSNKAHYLAGFLVAGISSRLELDQSYRDFLELVSSQIATVIANAREYEEEKRRAEALAEIDRAKTIFFSNVSHEFRTPLTLMLGPVEDLLVTSHVGLSPAAKGQLEVVNRNGLRLLRLVNTLLDFSRIEAGRVQAVFEPTDLAAFTTELASNFRSAMERAGLLLSVHCNSLPEPVYVDRDMWEKVMLNLLSNAFKFTLEGEIEVSLRASDGTAELRVRDTGVGIPAEEMPRLFERFHRAQNVRSRTHEGSGIGLALVQELVKLHGGTVRAESRLNEGTTFIVSIPLGKDHIPPDRIGANRSLASTAVGAAPFVEEALRWLPEASSIEEASEPAPKGELIPVPCPQYQRDDNRPWIIVADDNLDMRQYLARMLTERYNIEVVADGEAALEKARERLPDLILSDVMMPRLDGIGLVREIRADASLKTVPIILLSARAGEESRVEGLQQGADDYLIKPFSARELLARVAAHLEMARMRKESEEVLRESRMKLEAAMESMSDAVCISDKEGNIIDFNEAAAKLHRFQSKDEFWRSIAEYVGVFEAYFPDGKLAVPEMWPARRALRGEAGIDEELRILRKDTGESWIASYNFGPIRDSGGNIVGSVTTARDITERRQAEEKLRLSEEALRQANEQLEQRVRERTLDLQNLTEQLEKSRHELRNLASELIRTEERERKRIAGVLHDDIAQILASARMRLDMLHDIPSDRDKQALTDAKALLFQSIRETRNLMSDIGNPLLFDMGLKLACESLIKQMMERHPVRISCDIREAYKYLNPDMKALLFQVVRELLNNVVKHSQARNAHVKIDMNNGSFRIDVTDDGVGFDPLMLAGPTLEGGFGLYSLRERLIAMDGNLKIESAPGAGTVATAILPLSSE